MTLGETNVPDPDEGEVLIETDCTCISPGAELSSLAGRQPDAPPWPFIPGFMLVGHIVACGPHTPFKEETAVICSGSSTTVRVPSVAAMLSTVGIAGKASSSSITAKASSWPVSVWPSHGCTVNFGGRAKNR